MFLIKFFKKNKNEQTSWWLKWRRLKKRYKFLLIIILIIIAGFSWSKINKKKQWAANREIVNPVYEDLRKEIIRTGQIELQGVVEVRPTINGVITDLKIQNGQEVKKGEVLFKIKSTANASEKASAWSSFLSAKNTYEEQKISSGTQEWNTFESAKKAMMEIEDQIKTFEENFPEKKNHLNREYQQLKMSESIARRNLDAATLGPNQINDRSRANQAAYQAALSAYNASIDGTYQSPIAGTIENLSINEGENVTARVGTEKTGSPLFLIVPEGKKTISMQIGPNDALVMRPGLQTTVSSTYVKNATFSAQIVRVDKVGQSSTDKGLIYRAWLEVNDAENLLLLGTPVEISIITQEKTQVLTLPAEAVRDNLVTVVDEKGNFLEERMIETDLKAQGKIEITNGLNESDFVLIDRNIDAKNK